MLLLQADIQEDGGIHVLFDRHGPEGDVEHLFVPVLASHRLHDGGVEARQVERRCDHDRSRVAARVHLFGDPFRLRPGMVRTTLRVDLLETAHPEPPHERLLGVGVDGALLPMIPGDEHALEALLYQRVVVPDSRSEFDRAVQVEACVDHDRIHPLVEEVGVRDVGACHHLGDARCVVLVRTEGKRGELQCFGGRCTPVVCVHFISDWFSEGIIPHNCL